MPWHRRIDRDAKRGRTATIVRPPAPSPVKRSDLDPGACMQCAGAALKIGNKCLARPGLGIRFSGVERTSLCDAGLGAWGRWAERASARHAFKALNVSAPSNTFGQSFF